MQHGGKELSYLNLYDTEAAWRLVHRFEEPAVVIVKHANPCGVAVAADITDAYVAAHACDPVSAFGGIVAANRPVPAALAEALAPVFTEVVVAPSFDDDALSVLGAKKNLRVLSAPPPVGSAARPAQHRRRPAGAGGRSGLARPGGVDGADTRRSPTRPCGGSWPSPGRSARR